MRTHSFLMLYPLRGKRTNVDCEVLRYNLSKPRNSWSWGEKKEHVSRDSPLWYERTFLFHTSDSRSLLCHFLICLSLICLIRDAGDLETEFKLISVSLSLCPSQMARCMHWAGWEPTRPLRPRWGCMSRQKTSGYPSPPCPHPAMEPSPSCAVTRSMFWVSHHKIVS